jgi:hypothetical protein
LNGVLNRTVSDSRLTVAEIPGLSGAFQLVRLVGGDDAALELHGTPACLFVQQVVFIEDEQCRTESYVYSLQADASRGSWRIRWEYRRESPADYAYPRAHVHINGTFPDGTPIGALHIPTRRVSLEHVVRHLITDWGVKPRSDDWEAILEESAEPVCARRSTRPPRSRRGA